MQQVNMPGVRWEWISEAWNLFTKKWSVWVQMMLAMVLVVVAAYIPMVIMGFIVGAFPPEDPGIIAFLGLIFQLIFVAAIVGAMPWMAGGLYRAAFKQVRGEEISVRDLFSAGKYYLRILGASILIGIIINIGVVFCIVPGLVAIGLTFLTMGMIVEGGKGPIEAIKASIEVTKKDWLMFTLFAIALNLVAEAGALACGIGILATAPLLFLGHALAYRDLVGSPGAKEGGFMTPDYGSFTPPQTPYAPPDYSSYRTPSAPRPPDYRPSTPPQQPSAPQQQPAPPQPPSWAQETNVTPVVSEPATKTCPHCGATLARVVNFCNQCGRPLRNS